MGYVARILSGGETPVELIESAGWYPFRLVLVDAALFAGSEWKERHCSNSYPQTLKIRVGSDPINRLTHLADAVLIMTCRPHPDRSCRTV